METTVSNAAKTINQEHVLAGYSFLNLDDPVLGPGEGWAAQPGTRRIRLLPFTLAETEALLHSRGVELTRPQIVELYMVLGGVPHYLKEAEPGLSTAQIVDRACFCASSTSRN